MTDRLKAFKYSCRNCHIRRKCIDEKHFGPGLKIAIENTFRNNTDTFDTWQMLQEDCLLLRSGGPTPPKKSTAPESALVRRLRQARQASQKAGSDPGKTAHLRMKPKPALAVPRAASPPEASSEVSVAGRAGEGNRGAFGFTIIATERIVRLPDEGEVVLGRFAHGFSNPPDVDLALEDGFMVSVSRRHALVTGRRGEHWIEDMGSRNGTYVNGHPVEAGRSVQIAPGDRLLLGRCRLMYHELPDWARQTDSRSVREAHLVVTHTGRKIPVPQLTEIVVGRPDMSLAYFPDVDLSVGGDVAGYVSRRHIKITSRGGLHFVQEAGSASGTRLNGRPIHVGEPPIVLQHGDQLWLGGCVIAYESNEEDDEMGA